ncbi:MAG TPA: alcohol dehydrogenase, partial [Planctomycetaceae bacterium]|nr:alcohol dehydrogenase [Planctomycetaceae bacterium]
MRAVVWTGERDFEIQDVPTPALGEGQVLVEVRAAAICNTDFHYADFQSRPPIIPGHEVAGVIVDKTPEVQGLSVGDRVALDPVQRCGKCYPCSR